MICILEKSLWRSYLSILLLKSWLCHRIMWLSPHQTCVLAYELSAHTFYSVTWSVLTDTMLQDFLELCNRHIVVFISALQGVVHVGPGGNFVTVSFWEEHPSKAVQNCFWLFSQFFWPSVFLILTFPLGVKRSQNHTSDVFTLFSFLLNFSFVSSNFSLKRLSISFFDDRRECLLFTFRVF